MRNFARRVVVERPGRRFRGWLVYRLETRRRLSSLKVKVLCGLQLRHVRRSGTAFPRWKDIPW